MDEKVLNQNDEIEIDLQRLFKAILKKGWLVAIVSVLCAVLAFAGTMLFVTPEYQSAAMFYVNNNSISVGEASLSISSGDLSTSRNLVDTYIVVLNTRETLVDVADYAGVGRSYGEIRGMIYAEAVNETEIFRVVVTSPDPNEAEQIANAIAYILPKRIASIIEGTSARVVDAAIVPVNPSSPSYPKNTLIGFLLGFVACVGLIVLRELFDTTIRTEEDVEQNCKHPVLAAVPDMSAPSKGGYDYSYDRKKNKKADAGSHPSSLIGGGVSFSASEAYKLLRTKIQFSFAEENESHVIGVASALSGEGKSLTSINLAYTLSQLGKRVILVDCDMRRPTLAEKLNIQKKPGLSSYLTGQCRLETVLQYCNLKNEEKCFHVLTAGQNPPNPIELLNSVKMEKMLEMLRGAYDYIILDLPPVGEVSDALSVAQKADGMLLVVRQDFCDRTALAEAVRQFEFVNAKILGVVYNCTYDGGERYGKRHHKRGYKRYDKRYQKYGYGRKASSESAYAAAKQVQEMTEQ